MENENKSITETTKPIKKFGEGAYILATVLCSFGVCLSAKSGFGVSMVVAPSFVLSNYLVRFSPFFTFGNTDYIVQALMIVAIAIVVRKFKIKYPSAILSSVIYGVMLDGWRLIFGTTPFLDLYARVLSMAGGALITAFSIALYLRTYLPQQGYDLFVYETATNFNKNMTKVKWIYDLTSLAVAIILMLALFQKFDLEMVGIGTLLLTVVNTPLIALSGKLLDRFVDFSPALPELNEKLK